METLNSSSKRPRVARRRGFTMIELLVVMGIIAVLVSAVVAASSMLINKSKVNNTQAMLTVVRDAVDQFRREQLAQRTISKSQLYRDRFGDFPPDELEWFTNGNALTTNGRSAAPRGAVLVPGPPPNFGAMKFYTAGLPIEGQIKEHRDLVAMVLAIEVLGNESATILDRIQGRYRTPGPVDPTTSQPVLFLDRPGVTSPPDGKWSQGDHHVRYIVDDWGTPISYLAQRDWKPAAPAAAPVSTNHADWNEASTEMIGINNGQPIIFSYGPDGKEQLTRERMTGADPAVMTGVASLIGDFENGHRIDNPLNADNVYADPALKERLAKGK